MIPIAQENNVTEGMMNSVIIVGGLWRCKNTGKIA